MNPRNPPNADTRQILVVVSGYFGPLHIGHLDYIEAGASAGDRLFVIVNNNDQQIRKKGKIIVDELARVRIVRALRVVDDAMISIDDDETVSRSIAAIAERFASYRIVFGNGGDRGSGSDVPEAEVCERYGIEMVFGMGGNDKADSSTRINSALGIE